MSKTKLAFTAIALSGFGLFSTLSTPKAHAQAESGAVVSHGCPADIGEVTIDGYDIQYCFDLTVTPGGNANGGFQGSLTDRSTAPRKTVTITGFPCYAGVAVTYDTRLVITPSGELHGSCKYHDHTN